MTWGQKWTPPPKLRDMPPPAEVPGLYREVSFSGRTTGKPVEKHEYIRSPALMRAYRLIPCQHCGKDDGTVCGAHSNLLEHGKGRGIKASDEFGASLCHACHSMLDQGSEMTRSERTSMWKAAHRKTVAALVAGGLWPAGVRFPEGVGL